MILSILIKNIDIEHKYLHCHKIKCELVNKIKIKIKILHCKNAQCAAAPPDFFFDP